MLNENPRNIELTLLWSKCHEIEKLIAQPNISKKDKKVLIIEYYKKIFKIHRLSQCEKSKKVVSEIKGRFLEYINQYALRIVLKFEELVGLQYQHTLSAALEDAINNNLTTLDDELKELINYFAPFFSPETKEQIKKDYGCLYKFLSADQSQYSQYIIKFRTILVKIYDDAILANDNRNINIHRCQQHITSILQNWRTILPEEAKFIMIDEEIKQFFHACKQNLVYCLQAQINLHLITIDEAQRQIKLLSEHITPTKKEQTRARTPRVTSPNFEYLEQPNNSF